MKMLALCGNAGPLPEVYRPFLNAAGELQCGDAFGLEAQWLIGLIMEQPPTPQYPECDWTMVQIREDEQGTGCVSCGDVEADSVRGLCVACS